MIKEKAVIMPSCFKTSVRTLFKHPTGYVILVLTQTYQLELYDLMTLSKVATSNFPLLNLEEVLEKRQGNQIQ